MLGKKKGKVEFVDSKVEQDEIKGFPFKNLIDGSVLSGNALGRQLPYVIFLVLLGIIYISNRYNAEKMVRKIIYAKEEVKNLRAEQITTASELMNHSKPSTLEDIVERRGLGLKQPVSPPYKLIDKKKK